MKEIGLLDKQTNNVIKCECGNDAVIRWCDKYFCSDCYVKFEETFVPQAREGI